MSLLDAARDALKQLPLSDILRERLSLALDQAAVAESKVAELQVALGKAEAKIESVHAQLEDERVHHQQTKEELQRLRDEHAEEVRIHATIEFRRGKRTGGKWLPFCPRCHLPASTVRTVRCMVRDCSWFTMEDEASLPARIAEL